MVGLFRFSRPLTLFCFISVSSCTNAKTVSVFYFRDVRTPEIKTKFSFVSADHRQHCRTLQFYFRRPHIPETETVLGLLQPHYSRVENMLMRLIG